MKWLGAVLVLWGALEGFLLRRRERLLPLRVGQALAEDLEVLRCGVCLCRAPLPEILEHNLAEGAGARYLWGPLAALLSEAGERSLTGCWRQAAAGLPAPLRRILAPLGTLLPTGGERLAEAIEETREELTRFLRAERERQAAEGRVTAALCLSGASLLILVLI